MKILLIHPQNYLQRYTTGIYGRGLRYAPLTMPTLKALIPDDLNVEVKIVDEMIQELDLMQDADLVAITAITGTASRSYQIADHFRTRNIAVVMGGVHPTLNTAESLLHADSVVRGYAERTWPKLLYDFSMKKLQRIYEDDLPFDPSLIVPPDRKSIHPKDYFGWGTVEMSRGCPNNCDFCISHRFHSAYICRSIDAVIKEIKEIKSRILFFLDPNLTGDKEQAKAFFRELIKLKKWWVGCATLDITDDMELIELMAKSGCKGLLMGFESVHQKTLHLANKNKNIGRDYMELVNILHDYGISVQACFVFGFDTDDKSVFDEATEYIIKAKFDLPQISIYTPFPGTPVFEKMEKEKRILTYNWDCYNGQNAVFQPKQMSPEELEKGVDTVRKRVYSIQALTRRLFIKPLWIKPLVALSYLGFRYYQHRISSVNPEKLTVEALRPDGR